MEKSYPAVIDFALSGNSVPSTARKVALLTMFHISAYLISTILGSFALGSFGLMISGNQHWHGPVNL